MTTAIAFDPGRERRDGAMRYRRGVTEILWGPYQEHHIAVRHGVPAELFEAAWVDRVDLIVRRDGHYESVGATDDGRERYLVWRWDVFDPERVFPITAYFLPDER